MPALPWSARASLPPTYACFVTASRQVLRRPGPALTASTSVSWFCLAEELPVGWPEVQHRLRYAPAAGRVLS